MKASVIIPTYQRYTYLPEVLNSVLSQDFPRSEYEVFLVDNSQNPISEIQKFCESDYKVAVHYLHEPKNGLHHARHAGAREASGEILVYIDDDVICPSGWLSAILEPYDQKNVGAVGGKVKPIFEKSPPSWWVKYPGYFSILDRGDEIRDLHWPEDIYGCNFSVRKNILFELGGFNPDGFGQRDLLFYRGDGETGLVEKIFQAGYRVIYTPQGWLSHRVPPSRLTKEYMAKRAFNQGLSNGFAFYRRSRPGQAVLSTRILKEFSRSLIEKAALMISMDEAQKIEHGIKSAHWEARSRYDWRLLLSAEFREYVNRQNFLD
jgi:glycosyltransferase involved in cell wall biosynthesis